MNTKGSSTMRVVLTIIGVLAVLSLAFGAPGTVNLVGTWNHLNADQANPTPEHEVLHCGGFASISCRYDKQPEPELGFTTPPDSTVGYFVGQDATSDWACPAGFPADFCANVLFVASGTATYDRSDGTQLVVNEDLVVGDMSGQRVLYVYWVDYGFACPWYRSFAEALAANPFQPPFDGTNWPAQDCIGV